MRPFLTTLGFLVVVSSCSPLAVPRAPVPPPKKAPAQGWMPGKYAAYWSGTPWATTFFPNGDYVAQREEGPVYAGRWEMVQGSLVIEERQVPDGNPIRWEIKMDNTGLVSRDGKFRLVRDR